jgi:restriction system protein
VSNRLQEPAKQQTEQAALVHQQLRSVLKEAAGLTPQRLLKAQKDSSTFRDPKPQPPREPTLPPRPWLHRPRWEAQCGEIQKRYEAALKRYQQRLERWESGKAKQATARRAHNQRIATLAKEYDKTDSRLEEYFRSCVKSLLLRVPLKFPDTKRRPALQIHHDAETKSLVVDLRLPTPDAVPTLREVRFIKSRTALKRFEISGRERDKLYDDILYQLTVGIVGVAFRWDTRKTLSQVVVNGRVRFRDAATGNWVETCIISLQSSRQEFAGIRLAHVDAKSCFRKLKGVGSGKLHGLVPVAPLLEFNTRDDRFVAPRGVTGQLREGENLAAMDWEDFEHLVREVFEQEFARGGGQVKITRASRDRGVDAIAFDPDPIRGGKIVIQAKRYTNLVGVDAVRDLYGTVVSEGANLGILVSTSNYGPDAYTFAKEKPLRLLNGSNFLHLLQKHGHQARIDLQEAKRILLERDKLR